MASQSTSQSVTQWSVMQLHPLIQWAKWKFEQSTVAVSVLKTIFLAAVFTVAHKSPVFQVNMDKFKQFVIISAQFPPAQWAVAVMALSKLTQFQQAVRQWMYDIKYSVGQIEVTSQVSATRANIMEWRSCLQFGSQWHKVSLQAAYKLWQGKLLSCPACPANQWGALQSGQPMMQLDQSIADADLPSLKLRVLTVGATLSQAHEYSLLFSAAKLGKKSEQYLSDLTVHEQLHNEWQRTCHVTGQFDFNRHAQDIQLSVDQFEAKINWQSAIFQ